VVEEYVVRMFGKSITRVEALLKEDLDMVSPILSDVTSLTITVA
jgi:hypothetical protein